MSISAVPVYSLKDVKVPRKIHIYTFSAKLGGNGISIIIFLKAPALQCIFSGTWSSYIFGITSTRLDKN